MASLVYFKATPRTIDDKGSAYLEDMDALFAASWPNLPFHTFYRGFYDTSSNTVEQAKLDLAPLINRDFLRTFSTLDKTTKEDDMYTPFIREVNRILELRTTTHAAGVGRLWCYDVHKDLFITKRSQLKPDVVIMPRAPNAGVTTAPHSTPLSESTNAPTTSSTPILPDSARYGTRSSTRLASTENVPPSSQTSEASSLSDSSVEDIKAQLGGLHWGKVIVAMEVKPAVTPDKEAHGFSITDSSRSKIVKPGVEHVPPIVPKNSSSRVGRSGPSQQPQHHTDGSRSTALKRHVAHKSEVSAPKRRRTTQSSPDSTAATAGPLQTTSQAVEFTIPEPPEKAKAPRKKGNASRSKSKTSRSKAEGSASNSPILPMPAPFIIPSPASIQKPIESEPEEQLPKPTADDLQLGRYMTEMISITGNRSHAFGCILRGNLFQITYVDPNGIAISERRSLSEPAAALGFALFIYGLAGCSASALGFDSRFSVPPGYPGRMAGLLPLDTEGLQYKVKETQATIKGTIDLEYSLCGRRTRVFEVDFLEGDAIRHGVLKIGYPYASRPREYTLMSRAKTVLEQNMGHSRGIPLLYAEDSGNLVSEEFRRHLLKQGATPPVWPEDRRLEILLMERLYPIRSFPAPLHIKGMRQIVNTICALGESKFFHRDVSSSNCMVRLHPAEDNLQYFEGVLADFDLAVDQTTGHRPDSKHQHWTGTLPFLALDVLKFPGTSHITRFDLESAFYVTIWDMCLWPHGDTGKGEDPNATPIFNYWRRIETSRTAKRLLGIPDNGILTFTRLNDFIRDSADILQDKFAAPLNLIASLKRLDPTSDQWEDLGGLLGPETSRDAFAELDECLSKHLKTVQPNVPLVPYPWPEYPMPKSDPAVLA